MLNLTVSPEVLAQLIDQVASAVAAKLQAERQSKQDRQHVAERLALPAEEAAAAIGISPRLLWDLTKSGQIRATKCGSRVVYARSELLRFLEGPSK